MKIQIGIQVAASNYDFLFLFCAYDPIFDYFYVCKDNRS